MKKISINIKLIALGLILVLIPSLIIGFVGYNSAKKSFYKGVETNQRESAKQIALNTKIVYDLATDQLKSNLVLAHQIYYTYGKPEIVDGKMVLINDQGAKHVVNENYEIVDKVQTRMQGGTSTIFQLKDYTGDPQNITWTYSKAMYRISTNVKTINGERAIGTILSKPVYDTIMSGQSYYGRAWVVNAWYITGYEPIYNSENEIIGVLYVGIKEEAFQEKIKSSLQQQVVGKSGYIWILDYNGTYILSKNRLRDGENIWNAKDSEGNFFVQTLVNKGKVLNLGETDFLYYPWMNTGEKIAREKISGISHFKDWNWVIGSSVYLDDFNGEDELGYVKKQVILYVIITSLIGIILTYFVAMKITKPIKKLTETANKINDGDFEAKVDVTSNDEVGDLAAAMEGLVTGIKNLKQQGESLKKDKKEEKNN